MPKQNLTSRWDTFTELMTLFYWISLAVFLADIVAQGPAVAAYAHAHPLAVSWVYCILLVTALIGSMFPGIPVSLTPLFTGWALGVNALPQLPGVTAFSLVAVTIVVGSFLGYTMATKIPSPLQRWGLYASKHLTPAENWYAGSDFVALFFSRFYKMPTQCFVNYAAGRGGHNASSFLFWNILSQISWIALLGMLGYILGQNVC